MKYYKTLIKLLRFANPAQRDRESKTRAKYILGVSLTTFFSLFLAAGFVFAAVTLSQNIQLGSGTPDLTLNGDDLYVTGTLEVDGAARFDGDVTAKTLANVRFADQFSGADAGVKISACVADLPSTGGVCDARGLEGAQTISSDPFSGVTKPITLLLGHTTYTVSSQITIPKNSQVIGQGPGNTVFDFNGATGSFPDDAAIYAAGDGLTSLPALSATVATSSRAITFASAPSVSQDDVLVIFDSADYSYSGFRPVYKAGEYVIVDSISGNTITLAEPVLGGPYASGSTVSVFKMNNPTSVVIRDLAVIGRGNVSGNSTNTITIKFGRNARIINVEASNSNDTTVSLNKCFSCTVDRLVSTKLLTDAFGTSYALAIGNSQAIRVTNSDLLAVRHAITVGGGSETGDVVNRNLIFTNNRFRTTSTGGAVLAADLHGNVEYATYSNNISDGFNVGGNHNKIIGNTIFGSAAIGIHFSEMKGFDFTIADNDYFAQTSPPSGRGTFVDVGGNSNAMSASTTLGGVLSILNNKVYYPVADDAINAIVIRNRGSTVSDLRVAVKNNIFIGTKSTRGNDNIVFSDVESGSMFDRFDVIGNQAEAFGIANIRAANYTLIANNTSLNSGREGIRLVHTGPTAPIDWQVSGNYVRGAQLTGIYLAGTVAQPASIIKADNNTSIENVIAATGSSSTNTNLSIINATTVQVSANFIGGTQANQSFPARYETITTLKETRNHYFGTGSVSYVSVGDLARVQDDKNGALAITSGGTNQNITLTPSGTGNTILNGNVGIATSTPESAFHVTSAATTTITFDTTSGTQGTCLVMKDSTGATKYVRIEGTSFVINTTSCK